MAKDILESEEVFEAYARIDLCSHGIKMIYDDMFKPKSPIETMIDRATGYDKGQKEELRGLLEQIIEDKTFIEADCEREKKALFELNKTI